MNSNIKQSELNIENLPNDVLFNILRYLFEKDINRLSVANKKMYKNVSENQNFWNFMLKKKNIHILDDKISNRDAYIQAIKQLIAFKKLSSIKKAYIRYLKSKLTFFDNRKGLSNNIFYVYPWKAVLDISNASQKTMRIYSEYVKNLQELIALGYVGFDELIEFGEEKVSINTKNIQFPNVTFKQELDNNTLETLNNLSYPDLWSKIWTAKDYNTNVARVKALLMVYFRKSPLRFLDNYTRNNHTKVLKIIEYLDKNPNLTDEELVALLIHNASFESINLYGRFAKLLQFIFDKIHKSVNKVLEGNTELEEKNSSLNGCN